MTAVTSGTGFSPVVKRSRDDRVLIPCAGQSDGLHRLVLRIIGGTQVPSTPLAWARELHSALLGSALLSSEHYGHSAVVSAGECVASVLRNYFERLVVPPPETVCPHP